MANIFIFQSRRIGDFFQSVPLMESLFNLDNNVKQTLYILADESVAGISEIFDKNVNFITYKDIFGIFAADNHISLNALSGLSASDFLLFLNKFTLFLPKYLEKYDIAVNLNYDSLNALFINFFKNNKKGPIAYNKGHKNNETILISGTSNYLFNAVRSRNLNRINIVDIFSLIGTNKPAEIKHSYDIIKLKSKKNATDSKQVRICISIGATSAKRIWPADYYARLIELISKNFDSEIILVGTKDEVEAASKIKKKISPEINLLDLTGKTTLSELVYLIKDFDLLISADTGTLHIAQIFNIPTVSIFTGNANFYETGPHIKDSLVIYSKIDCYPCYEHEPCRFNYTCKNDIKPPDVYDLVKLQLKTDKTDLKAIKNEITHNIKKGNFSVSFCEHFDSVHFYPFVKEEINKNSLASEVLKFCWLTVLSEDNVKPDLTNILRNTEKYYRINKITLKSLKAEISYIKTVFENGRDSFGSSENGAYFEKFKEYVKTIGNNYDYLRLACDYFACEIESAGINKGFNDIIMLLNNAIQILNIWNS